MLSSYKIKKKKYEICSISQPFNGKSMTTVTYGLYQGLS